jgi:hypothetical protein
MEALIMPLLGLTYYCVGVLVCVWVQMQNEDVTLAWLVFHIVVAWAFWPLLLLLLFFTTIDSKVILKQKNSQGKK